jgi:ribosomal protein S1
MQIISGTIVKIEDGKIFVKANGAGEFCIPADTTKWKAGDNLKIALMKDDINDPDRQNLAKNILNEILADAE